MTPIPNGIQYTTSSNKDSKSSLRPQCWKCRGKGLLLLKPSRALAAEVSSSSLNDKGLMEYFKACKICQHDKSDSEPARSGGRVSVFRGYEHTGPTTPGNVADEEFQPQQGETLCSLSGHYMIYQYTRGHRFTTDDVCTAYFAYTETKLPTMDRDDHPSIIAGKVRSHLDLGCGLGSVLLMLKWKYGKHLYKSVGVEAQHANLVLARRSIAFNGLQVGNRVLRTHAHHK